MSGGALIQLGYAQGYLHSCILHASIGCLHVLEQQGLQHATGMQLGEHVWARDRGIP